MTNPYAVPADPFAEFERAREANDKRRKPSMLARIIGVIGELMITAGLVIGGFVVWQLWWTDVTTNKDIAKEIEVVTADFGGEVTEESGIAKRHFDDPPAWNQTDIAVGDAMGIVRIPSIDPDYQYVLKEGVDAKSVLDTGAFGHYDGTAFPGEIGNFSMAVHRRLYGSPMRHVDQLKPGDKIVIETAQTYYVYSMKDYEIVDPSKVYVVAPDPYLAKPLFEAGENFNNVEPTKRMLTMTTCHPWYTNTHRYIVHAELEYWTVRDEGLPIDLVPEADRPADWEEKY